MRYDCIVKKAGTAFVENLAAVSACVSGVKDVGGDLSDGRSDRRQTSYKVRVGAMPKHKAKTMENFQ